MSISDVKSGEDLPCRIGLARMVVDRHRGDPLVDNYAIRKVLNCNVVDAAMMIQFMKHKGQIEDIEGHTAFFRITQAAIFALIKEEKGECAC